MATCNHCGYKNAVDGKLCPNCGRKVEDNALAYMLIIIAIIVLVSFIVGPAFLLFKSYKKRDEKHTNWWLIGAFIASIVALIVSPYFIDERGEWVWFSELVFYINLLILLGSLGLFTKRLMDVNYKFIELFKTKNLIIRKYT